MPEPRLINLRSPEGKTYAVPEDELGAYQSQGWAPETGDEFAGRISDEVKQEKYGGVGGAIGSAATGALSGLTLGLSDAYLSALGGRETLEGLKSVNPGANLAGNIVGSALPAFFTGGASAEAGIGSALARTPAGIANAAGHAASSRIAGEGAGVLARAAGATAGAAAEGAIFGGGQYLSEQALENKPLAAEGFLASVGKGALFAAPVGGAFSLGGSALQRARSMFPKSELSKEAAAVVKSEASSAIKSSVTDADDMIAAAKDKIAENEAAAGVARGNEHVTRTVFGAADPAVVEAQAAAAAENVKLQQAAERMARANDDLKKWMAAGGDLLSDPDELVKVEDMLSGMSHVDAGELGAAIPGVPRGEFDRTWNTRPSAKDLALAEVEDEQRRAGNVISSDRALSTLGPDSGPSASRGRLYAPGSFGEPSTISALNDSLSDLGDIGNARAMGRSVPVGEFSAPGVGGIKTPEELARAAIEAGQSSAADLSALAPDATGAARPKLRGHAINDVRTPAELDAARYADDLAALGKGQPATTAKGVPPEAMTTPSPPKAKPRYVDTVNVNADVDRMSLEELQKLDDQIEGVYKSDTAVISDDDYAALDAFDARMRAAKKRAATKLFEDANIDTNANVDAMSRSDLRSLRIKAGEVMQSLPVDAPEQKALEGLWDRIEEAQTRLEHGPATSIALDNSKTGFLSEDEFNAMAENALAAMTSSEQEMAQNYSGNGQFALINAPLRRRHGRLGGASLKSVDPSLREMITTMDSAMKRSPAPRAMTVSRGVNGIKSVRHADGLKVGDSFVDPGFVSTSYDDSIGAEYAKGFGVHRGVKLEISVPEGYPAIAIPSLFPKEREVLLGRGGRFTVTDIIEPSGDGAKVIKVSLAPAEAPAPAPPVPEGFRLHVGKGKQFKSEPEVISEVPKFSDISGDDSLHPRENVFVLRPSDFIGKNLRIEPVGELPAWTPGDTDAVVMQVHRGGRVDGDDKLTTAGYTVDRDSAARFASAIADDRPIAVQFFPAVQPISDGLSSADDIIAGAASKSPSSAADLSKMGAEELAALQKRLSETVDSLSYDDPRVHQAAGKLEEVNSRLSSLANSTSKSKSGVEDAFVEIYGKHVDPTGSVHPEIVNRDVSLNASNWHGRIDPDMSVNGLSFRQMAQLQRNIDPILEGAPGDVSEKFSHLWDRIRDRSKLIRKGLLPDIPAENEWGITASESGARRAAEGEIPTFESLAARPDGDQLETTVPASKIRDRGWYEPEGGHEDTVRNENARRAIAEGQRDPIKLVVSESGKIQVVDGRHRLAAAVEADAPIRVKWYEGAEPAPHDVFKGGPQPEPDLAALKPSPTKGKYKVRPTFGPKFEAAAEVRPPVNATPESDDLSALLAGTSEQLKQGKSMREISAPAEAKYVADKAAKTAAAAEEFRARAKGATPEDERIAEALRNSVPTPDDGGRKGKAPTAAGVEQKTIRDKSIRAEMQRLTEDEQIERLLQKHNGKDVDIGPSIERAAKVISEHESASADLADALGDRAPRTAVDRAAQFRQAGAKQADQQASSVALATDGLNRTAVDIDIPSAMAGVRNPDATAVDANLGVQMAATKANSRAEAAAAKQAAKDSAKAAREAARAAKTISPGGSALETLSALGVHVPFLGSIPVIGPILNAFLRARAVLGIIGRKGGSIGRTVESTIAGHSAAAQDRIDSATNSLLRGIGRGAKKLSEVTAGPAVNLGHSLFPGGPDSRTKDPQRLYRARMDELARAKAPGAVEDAIGDRYHMTDAQLQMAVAAQARKGLDFLDSKAPKPQVLPGMLPGSTEYRPSKVALDQFGRYVHAVQDPISVIEDLAKGHLSLEGAEVLRTVYPELFKVAQRKLIEAAPDMQTTVPYAKRIAISILYQVPADPTMQPGLLKFIAAPTPGAAAQSPQGSPSGGGAPGLTGQLQIGQQTLTSLDQRAGS